MPSSAPAAPVASTTVVDNSAFGGPNATQAAAANAVLASSASSRATTTSNINTLQTALNTLPPTPASGTPGSSTNGGANAQTTTSTGTNVAPSTQTTSGGGSTTTTPTYTPPSAATQVSLPGGGTGYYTVANGTTPESMTDANGNPLTYSQSVGGWIDPSTGAAPVVSSNSSSGSDSSGGTDTNASAVTGLPTNLQSIAKSNLDNLDAQYQSALSAVSAAQATLANDPALAAAVSTITAQYQQLYEAMGLKNQQVLGRANSEVGAFGGLGSMNTSFLSNEMDAAQSRLSDIISKEQSAIVAAQAAYNKGDVAALNAATTQLKDAQTAKSTAVQDLLTATNNAVKTQQAQAKIDLTTQQDSLKSDVTNSTNLGASIATDLAAQGITDPDEIAAYVAQQAAANNLPEAFVEAAVTKAMQTATKASDASANTASEITDRDSNAANTTIKTNIAVNKANNPTTGTAKGGTDGSYTYTSSDLQQYTNLLDEGGTGPNGTKYNGRGTDGYVDPGSYTAALSDWVDNGGTPAGFAKKFPVKTNVNPTSYSELPASIQPKAAAAAASYSTTSSN